MITDRLGLPIKIFLANLLFAGVTLAVVDGKLRVGGKTSILSPVYRDEIMKRKEHLIDLLSPVPPPSLRAYCYRLLKVRHLQEALNIAAQERIEVWHLPVNGGWLIGPTGNGDGYRRNEFSPTKARQAVIQTALHDPDQHGPDLGHSE